MRSADRETQRHVIGWRLSYVLMPQRNVGPSRSPRSRTCGSISKSRGILRRDRKPKTLFSNFMTQTERPVAASSTCRRFLEQFPAQNRCGDLKPSCHGCAVISPTANTRSRWRSRIARKSWGRCRCNAHRRKLSACHFPHTDFTISTTNSSTMVSSSTSIHRFVWSCRMIWYSSSSVLSFSSIVRFQSAR